MEYFEKIKHNIDVRPFLNEIDLHANAWNVSTGRQEKIQVQREAQSIPLRGLVKSKIGNRKRRDVHESRYTTTSERFIVARAFLESFAAEQDSELGRAKIVRLMPGRRVYPHIDRGEYYRLRNRYHLVMQSDFGSCLISGGEEVRMQVGELWWFDNKAMHEAHNDGDAERIHMIFDLLPRALVPFVYSEGRAA
jgi:transcriptional regulator of met regulon